MTDKKTLCYLCAKEERLLIWARGRWSFMAWVKEKKSQSDKLSQRNQPLSKDKFWKATQKSKDKGLGNCFHTFHRRCLPYSHLEKSQNHCSNSKRRQKYRLDVNVGWKPKEECVYMKHVWSFTFLKELFITAILDQVQKRKKNCRLGFAWTIQKAKLEGLTASHTKAF
jgi:hypothetical protein